MNIKRKLMRYAMLYIAEQVEEVFPDNENMTPEKFIDLTETEFIYEESIDGSRMDAHITIIQHGEMDAEFTFNISR